MKQLIFIAGAQAIVYGVIAWQSVAFAFGSKEQDRPILSMLALFLVSFVLYLYSIRVAIRCAATRRLVAVVVVSAIVYRCILLPTPLIQELDLYRYLWDGAATAQGVHPYRFAPAQVLSAEPEADAEVRRLVALRDGTPALGDVLGRIHYAEIPTIYPPVSQAVFAVGHWLTPGSASVETRGLILKALLLAFDVGTISLVWLLLQRAAKHPGYVVAYAWCPLVLKEFANSGHLDSIAVFLTTAAIWCVVRQLACRRDQAGTRWWLAGAMLLALAIGAKLYAVVLLPVLCAAIAANARPARALMFAVVATLLSTVCLAPMLLTSPIGMHPTDSAVEVADGPPDAPTTTGLRAFLTRWEMNDFLFMLTVENIRPADGNELQPPAWFAIVPNAWRVAAIGPVADALAIDVRTAAFLVARAATTLVLLAVVLLLARRVCRTAGVDQLLEAAFLTLAWFWLLSPTQNPWYWTWALPLLPFARGRAWYAVSGLVMLYYLRFWLQYQFADVSVLGTTYDGPHFFDFVVTWIEYAPWFAWQAISACRRRWRTTRTDATTGQASVAGFTETTRTNA